MLKLAWLVAKVVTSCQWLSWRIWSPCRQLPSFRLTWLHRQRRFVSCHGRRNDLFKKKHWSFVLILNINQLLLALNWQLTKWWVLREALDAHWLGWSEDNHGSITRFDELGVVFKFLTRTTINLLLKFRELAGNVSCVAIEDRCVSSVDLSRVVQDDDLKVEKRA